MYTTDKDRTYSALISESLIDVVSSQFKPLSFCPLLKA